MRKLFLLAGLALALLAPPAVGEEDETRDAFCKRMEQIFDVGIVTYDAEDGRITLPFDPWLSLSEESQTWLQTLLPICVSERGRYRTLKIQLRPFVERRGAGKEKIEFFCKTLEQIYAKSMVTYDAEDGSLTVPLFQWLVFDYKKNRPPKYAEYVRRRFFRNLKIPTPAMTFTHQHGGNRQGGGNGMKRLLFLAGIALALSSPAPAIANGWVRVRNPADTFSAWKQGLWQIEDTTVSLGDPTGVSLSTPLVYSSAGDPAIIDVQCGHRFTSVVVFPEESFVLGGLSNLSAKVDGVRYELPLVTHEFGTNFLLMGERGNQLIRRAIREELPVKIAVPLYQKPTAVFEWTMKGGASAWEEACPPRQRTP